MDATRDLLRAARSLDLTPRTHRWRSVTACVLDAVWSIGVRYDRFVVPYVRNVVAELGGGDPLTENMGEPGPDPIPLGAFRRRFSTAEELLAATSRHLTSSRSGILKAEAALRYADVLQDHDIDTLHDAWSAVQDVDRAATISSALRRIPGDGVRTGYFWMLVGSTDHVKPDRHVLAWLAENGHRTDVAGAKVILTELSKHLSQGPGQALTPSDLDHAIWRAQSRR